MVTFFLNLSQHPAAGIATLLLVLAAPNVQAVYCVRPTNNIHVAVTGLWVTQEGVLVFAGETAYRMQQNRMLPLAGLTPSGQENIAETTSGVLIASNTRLFRLQNGEIIPEDFDTLEGPLIFTVGETSSYGTLVGTQNGLYRLATGRQRPFDGTTDKSIRSIEETVEGDVLLGTDSGLFRLSGNSAELSAQTGPVKAMRKTSAGIVVVADRGLYRFVHGEAKLVPNTKGIKTVEEIRSGLLVGIEDRLYRWKADDLKVVPGNIGIVKGIRQTALGVLVWTEDGSEEQPRYRLFLLSENDDLRELYGHGTAITAIEDAGEAMVLIGTVSGLGRLVTSRLDDADIKLVHGVSKHLPLDQQFSISWTLERFPCADVSESFSQYLIVSQGGNPIDEITNIRRTEPRNQGYEATLGPFDEKGSYELAIFLESRFEEKVSSQAFDFSIGKTMLETTTEWTKLLGGWGAVFHFSIFVVLVLAGRWSRICFELLTAPFSRKFGLYFGLALQYVKPIRLWVFERYFREVKRLAPAHLQYIPVPVTAPDGLVISSTELLASIQPRCRLWIRGEAGTGKTVLVQSLMREYFAEPSLWRAWQKYRFIPIFVTVRAYGNFAARADQPWVPEVSRAALDFIGVSFSDEKYYRRLLESGGFIVVLDGMNETPFDEDVRRYANTARRVGLMMTSQSSLGETSIPEYRLPRATREFTKQLLSVFLGERRGATMFAALTDALLHEVRSGYDVRIIADLAEKGLPMPYERLGLYQATLAAVDYHTGQLYPEDVICQAAWELWLSGARRFRESERLTSDLLAPLEMAKVIVGRGDSFEFRHDLLRGYLAARWAVFHAASMAETIMRLNDEEVWRLSPSEQDLVFPFLAALFREPEHLQAIAQLAAAEPGRRVRLLEASQVAAKRNGWSLRVDLVEHSVQGIASLASGS